MRDRFKFRAWDGKKMVSDFHLISFDGVPCYECQDDYYNTVSEKPDLTLMQSTPIRDRTGELIFEGDILEEEFGDGFKFIIEIKFDDIYSNLVGVYRAHESKGYIGRVRQFCEMWNCTTHDITTYKILGNIYEHPHLLEEL